MKRVLSGLAFAAALGASAYADSNRGATYKVVMTNLTKATTEQGDPTLQGQIFAPIVVATHKPGASIFVPGQTASAGLEELAETGSPASLIGELESDHRVSQVQNTAGMLFPGRSVTVYIKARRGANLLGVAGMLVTTNDGFAGLNGVALPTGHDPVIYYAPAWDAGTEVNDEKCEHIPGPPCGTDHSNLPSALDIGDPEGGVVHVHNGIHGLESEITPEARDWRNPVMAVYISRLSGRKHDDN